MADNVIFKSKDGRIVFRKFNPYHGRNGRFSSATSAASFTIASNKPDMAGKLANAKAKETERVREENKKRRAERDRIKEQEEREHKETMKERVKNEFPGINQETIRRADDTSFSGSRGTALSFEAVERVDSFKEKMKPKDDWNGEQKEYAKTRETEYAKLIEECYNDRIARYANNPSWVVTGRSGYDAARANKKEIAARNKADEYEEKLSKFEENTNKKIKSMESSDKQVERYRQGKWKYGETIDSADPLAQKKLQAKLDYLNENQTNMKAANSYYKKNGKMSGFKGFDEAENKRIDDEINDLASRGRVTQKPFESFELTGNNAKIKATQQRLKDLENAKAKVETRGASQAFKGGQLVRNAEANRLQLQFDGKPSDEMRAKLKANGFKWAPSQNSWQRQLTDNAEIAAKRILQDIQ